MNVELPGSTTIVVVTDTNVETATFVMVSGFVPNTAVAPEGSPLALSVSVQGLLFPSWAIEVSKDCGITGRHGDARGRRHGDGAWLGGDDRTDPRKHRHENGGGQRDEPPGNQRGRLAG